MFRKTLKLLPIFILALSLLVSCNNGGGETPGGDPGTGDPVKKDPVVTEQAETLDVKKAFVAVDDGPLPYRIYVPADYSTEYAYPVLVFLHGAGERGDDNEKQLKNVVQTLFDDPSSPIYQCIVIAPQCPEENQWVDTPWGEGSYNMDRVEESNELQSVMAILDTVKGTYSVNDQRIYAMGLSMGGFGTWDLLLRHGEVFAAAIPICGGGDPQYADFLVNKPIHTFHGDIDVTVPVSATREMVEALEEFGSTSITYEELEGYGHNVWDYAAEKEGLMDWLFAQQLAKES